jgi:hypothetical protein
MSAEEQFERIGKALLSIENPTLRAHAAMEAFGRSGTRMLSVVGKLEAARGAGGEYANVMKQYGPEFAKGHSQVSILGDKFGEFFAGVGSQVVPGLNKAIEPLTKFDAASAGKGVGGLFGGIFDFWGDMMSGKSVNGFHWGKKGAGSSGETLGPADEAPAGGAGLPGLQDIGNRGVVASSLGKIGGGAVFGAGSDMATDYVREQVRLQQQIADNTAGFLQYLQSQTSKAIGGDSQFLLS